MKTFKSLECLLKTHLEGALYLHFIKKRLPSTQIGIDKDDLVTTKKRDMEVNKKTKNKKALISTIDYPP